MKYKGLTIQKRKDCNSWYTRYRKNGKQFFISGKTQQECYDKLKLELDESKNDQKILFNKIQLLDEMQLKQVNLFVDKLIEFEKEQKQLFNSISKQKNKTQKKNNF